MLFALYVVCVCVCSIMYVPPHVCVFQRIVAAMISFVLAFFEEGDEQWVAFVEPLVIVLILVANATVGVLQESSAEDAVEELKRFQTVNAATRRNGRIVSLPAEDLVPGDIVELEGLPCGGHLSLSLS
jgi:magnesium-transporting ATPase (P-type)